MKTSGEGYRPIRCFFPGGRLTGEDREEDYKFSFVLLIYLDGKNDFSGYFLNPCVFAGRPLFFSTGESFFGQLEKITGHLEKLNRENMTSRICRGWTKSIQEETKPLAVYMEVSDQGNWSGRIYNPEKDVEKFFFSRQDLEKELM